MDYLKAYESWLASDIDENTRAELEAISGDEEEIRSRFETELMFGTAGLRGIIGAGTSRMNIYTVGQATQALASLILSHGDDAKKRGVCIAYDSRRFSDVFARHAARVLSANGIKAYVFDALRPTPELSFAVRFMGAIAGINITASHNPKEYNGYKVYWEDGAQMSLENSAKVADIMKRTDIFRDVKLVEYEDALADGIVDLIGRKVDRAYIENVTAQIVDQSAIEAVEDEFKVVFTPFHGAGYRLVPEVLERVGIRQVIPVWQQLEPDGEFPTVKSPNPENPEGFELAIKLAEREKADIIIGTDPDSDRLGVVSRTKDGEYKNLTGNQIGALLLDYIIKGLKRTWRMPKNPVAIKTVVSSELFRRIAEKNNVALVEVLTGFKFIGEKILEFERTGEYNYIFGYEESYGFLKGTYCRDKDAVVASMLVCEMASFYKAKNMTLFDAMEAIYDEYGCYLDDVINVTSPKLKTTKQMGEAMARVRENVPESIGTLKVTAVRDYLTGVRKDTVTGETSTLDLPKSDVLYYELSDGSRFVMRPSGTEPKLKIYFLICGDTMAECEKKREDFKNYAAGILEKFE